MSWETHAGYGETARLAGIVFFIVLAVFVLLPWYTERRSAGSNALILPKVVAPALAGLVLIASAATVFTVVQAGHSGAKSVWCNTMNPPNCDPSSGSG